MIRERQQMSREALRRTILWSRPVSMWIRSRGPEAFRRDLLEFRTVRERLLPR